MESKFKPGDKVRVIKYGHPMWTTLKGYYSFAQLDADFKSELLYGMKGLVKVIEPIILYNDNNTLTIDTASYLVGQEGIVDSISDRDYSLSGIPGKSAWYNEEQLELI